MTSISAFASAISAISGAAAGGLVTTITSATQVVKSKKKGTKVTATLEAHGFDAGADPHGQSGFGSIVNAIYDDGGANSRTVDSCYYVTDQETGAKRRFLNFVLATNSVPDTDTTFVSIKIDGTTFTRASATYTAVMATGTMWRWTAVTPDPFAGANPDDFEVVI